MNQPTAPPRGSSPASASAVSPPPHPLYDVPVLTLEGTRTTLGQYRDKAVLIVNVASQCGFTPQYTGLEALHREFAPHGFAVLGFPCNQFGEQEPGDADEIRKFCTLTYDVTFPLYAKVDVNGAQAHPVWRWLQHEKPGLLGTEAIKWNFTKFLVAPGGRVVRRFGPQDEPADLKDAIRGVLPAK